MIDLIDINKDHFGSIVDAIIRRPNDSHPSKAGQMKRVERSKKSWESFFDNMIGWCYFSDMTINGF